MRMETMKIMIEVDNFLFSFKNSILINNILINNILINNIFIYK